MGSTIEGKTNGMSGEEGEGCNKDGGPDCGRELEACQWSRGS